MFGLTFEYICYILFTLSNRTINLQINTVKSYRIKNIILKVKHLDTVYHVYSKLLSDNGRRTCAEEQSISE